MEEIPVTDVTKSQDQGRPGLSAADERLLRELTERARTGGVKLTGEGGLLGKLTKMVDGGALEGELDDHLGYGKHGPAGRDGGNSRGRHLARWHGRARAVQEEDRQKSGRSTRALMRQPRQLGPT